MDRSWDDFLRKRFPVDFVTFLVLLAVVESARWSVDLDLEESRPRMLRSVVPTLFVLENIVWVFLMGDVEPEMGEEGRRSNGGVGGVTDILGGFVGVDGDGRSGCFDMGEVGVDTSVGGTVLLGSLE